MTKKKTFLDYGLRMILMIVGLITVFVVLIFGFMFAMEKIFEERPVEVIETKQEVICQNLERVVDDKLSVYPQIIAQKLQMEDSSGYRLTNIVGNSSKPWRWDERGVSCQINAEMCDWLMTHCLDVRMLVPVNYTEWEWWFIKDGGKQNGNIE